MHLKFTINSKNMFVLSSKSEKKSFLTENLNKVQVFGRDNYTLTLSILKLVFTKRRVFFLILDLQKCKS